MRVRAGPGDDAALGRRVGRDADRLRAAFGRPRPARALPPIDELVLTILSQNTSDTNSTRAFDVLRRRFPTWDDVARAPRRSIEAAIRAGGLARLKSRVIRETLRRIARERGSFDLAFLERLPVPEALAWLRRFRGVGEKTACCVLLFGCRRPAFPVDTHIMRVTRRPTAASSGRPARTRISDVTPRVGLTHRRAAGDARWQPGGGFYL